MYGQRGSVCLFKALFRRPTPVEQLMKISRGFDHKHLADTGAKCVVFRVPIFGKTALFNSFCFCLWLKEMHSSKPSKKPLLPTPTDPTESAAFTSVVETTAHLGSFLHSGQTYQLLPAEVSGIKLNTDWPSNFTTEK